MLGPKLTSLLGRLEAATSRLEDMAQPTFDSSAQGTPAASTSAPGAGGIAPAAAATAAAATAGGRGAHAVLHTPTQAPAEVLPASIGAFDQLVAADVKKFVGLSEQIGGVVAEQVSLFSTLVSRRARNVTMGAPVR